MTNLMFLLIKKNISRNYSTNFKYGKQNMISPIRLFKEGHLSSVFYIIKLIWKLKQPIIDLTEISVFRGHWYHWAQTVAFCTFKGTVHPQIILLKYVPSYSYNNKHKFHNNNPDYWHATITAAPDARFEGGKEKSQALRHHLTREGVHWCTDFT